MPDKCDKLTIGFGSSKFCFTPEAIDKYVRNDLDEEEKCFMGKYPRVLRSQLLQVKLDVEQKLIERKADSMYRGYGNQTAMVDFSTWKSGATFFKSRIERCLADLKDGSGQEPMAPILKEILNELKSIKDFLITYK